jgi:transcription-repair coupling factor (superfamily II helicase)
MDMDAFIPSTYIKNEVHKLDIYKRIADIENEEEMMDMQEELVDRFGDMPAAVNNLLNIALLKAIYHSVYVVGLTHKDNEAKLMMYPKARLNAGRIPELVAKYKNTLKFIPQINPYFEYKLPVPKGKADALATFDCLKKLLGDFNTLRQDL